MTGGLSKNRYIILLVSLLIFLLVYPINSEVSIDENVELTYNNITFKVSSTKTFDTIEVGSNYIQFNDTRFYITAPNPTTITLNSLQPNINTTYDETVNLLNISTVTSGGNVTFNISSFRPHNHYKINIDNNHYTYQANDTGFLHFYINSWSNHNITINTHIILPNVTTNSSTGVEETNATLHGYLVDDGGEPCTVGFEYGTTTSYDSSVISLYPGQNVSRPTANGSIMEWDSGGWYDVDDTTPDYDSTKITLHTNTWNTSSGDFDYKTDIFEIQNLSISGDYTINWLKVTIVAGEPSLYDDGVTQYMSPAIYTHNTLYNGSISDTTGGYKTVSYTWYTNPFTGNNWTLEEINDLEIGIKGQCGSRLYCTQIYATINISVEGWASGNTFSYNLSSLQPGQLYHYRAYATNSNGTSYGSDITFLTKPLPPTSATTGSYNTTHITLTWTKGEGADKTVIRYSNTSYPATPQDGIEVYNGTGITARITYNIGETSYYSLWSYTSDGGLQQFSDTNDTLYFMIPGNPNNFTYTLVDDDTINLTWTRGVKADTTVIIYKTTGLPNSPSDGTVIYNSTGNYTLFNFSIGTTYYFKAYSYNNSYYSPGGTPLNSTNITISVYREDKPWIAIGNYTVFVTNQDGSETFYATGCNNPYSVNVSSIPNGENIIIQVSKEGYNTRSKIYSIYNYIFSVIRFYLPPSSEGSPSGEENESWYVPPEGENGSENVSYGESYIVEVYNEVDEPVEDAFVSILFYNNNTGIWDTVFSGYTDSAGQLQVSLIPDTTYFVNITKTGFQSLSATWVPQHIEYYQHITKRFTLYYKRSNPDLITGSDIITFYGNMDSSGNITIYYNDDTSKTINTTIVLYQDYNYSLTYLTYNFKSSNSSFNITFTGYNSSMKYKAKLYLNHTQLGYVTMWCDIYPYVDKTTESILEDRFVNVLGPLSLGWVKLLIIFLPTIFFLLVFGGNHLGLGIISSGLYIGFTAMLLDVSSTVSYYTISGMLVMVGIIMIIIKYGNRRV